jgi:hypothetical protein
MRKRFRTLPGVPEYSSSDNASLSERRDWGVTGTTLPCRAGDDHLTGGANLWERHYVTQALSSLRVEQHAVETAPKSVESRAQARANQIESESDQAMQVSSVSSGRARDRSGKLSHCSFCRAELDESLALTILGSGDHGRRASTGSFCSTHCRNCVLALAALHPSPLASHDFVAKRAAVTDRLLDLWRRGEGPDPCLVLQAAERAASTGFPTAPAHVS